MLPPLKPGWTPAEPQPGSLADHKDVPVVNEDAGPLGVFLSPATPPPTGQGSATRAPGSPLRVVMTREPFDEMVTLFYDGNSEELEYEEARKWFLDRGAEPNSLDQALIHVWSFYKGAYTIRQPIEKSLMDGILPSTPGAPQV